MRSALIAVLALSLTLGCYRSHARVDGIDSGAPVDAGGPDAPVVDGGPIACTSIAIVATALLDEGVTPRVAAIGGDDVGVVYVRTDGSPTRVLYERLDRGLARRIRPVTIATESFTWAELAVLRGELQIAYGLAGGDGSVLVRAGLDGARVDRVRVPLEHPSLLQPAADGLFWAAFAMRDGNALEISHLDAAGTPRHPVVTIPLGRYGSGHGAVARDARSHVVTYPREGPRGVRRGYVTSIDPSGALGPERLLDPDGSDSVVRPVRRRDDLVLVRSSDDELVLERVDPETLETTERHAFPALGGSPVAAALGDRIVLVHPRSGTLVVDDFGPALGGFERHEVALAGPAVTSAASIAELPGALVAAITVTEGATARPALIRIECADVIDSR